MLAFEVFAVVYALGGRNFPVLVGEAYIWQNENQNYGVAAAYAVLMMAISLAATVGVPQGAARQAGAMRMSARARPAAAPSSLWIRRRGAVRLGAGADLSRSGSAPSAAGRRRSAGRRPIWPSELRWQAMLQFLRIEGVCTALMNSLIAAGFTMLFSLAARRAGRLRAGALPLPRRRTPSACSCC